MGLDKVIGVLCWAILGANEQREEGDNIKSREMKQKV
jgi:hypothetical protein